MLASRQFPLEKRITASRKSSFSPKGQLVLKPAVKKPINNKKNQTYTTNKKHRCKSIHTKTLDYSESQSQQEEQINSHSFIFNSEFVMDSVQFSKPSFQTALSTCDICCSWMPKFCQVRFGISAFSGAESSGCTITQLMLWCGAFESWKRKRTWLWAGHSCIYSTKSTVTAGGKHTWHSAYMPQLACWVVLLPGGCSAWTGSHCSAGSLGHVVPPQFNLDKMEPIEIKSEWDDAVNINLKGAAMQTLTMDLSQLWGQPQTKKGQKWRISTASLYLRKDVLHRFRWRRACSSSPDVWKPGSRNLFGSPEIGFRLRAILSFWSVL